jgi:hypothetical protein
MHLGSAALKCVRATGWVFPFVRAPFTADRLELGVNRSTVGKQRPASVHTHKEHSRKRYHLPAYEAVLVIAPIYWAAGHDQVVMVCSNDAQVYKNACTFNANSMCAHICLVIVYVCVYQMSKPTTIAVPLKPDNHRFWGRPLQYMLYRPN